VLCDGNVSFTCSMNLFTSYIHNLVHCTVRISPKGDREGWWLVEQRKVVVVAQAREKSGLQHKYAGLLR
jgi:hypothetical protein